MRLDVGGRQRDAASQLWSRTSQPGDNNRCPFPHSLPVHVGPDFGDGEYGEGDEVEPQFGVADGSAVVELEVVPGQGGTIHDTVDGVGEALVRHEELTENLGVVAPRNGGRRRQVPV